MAREDPAAEPGRTEREPVMADEEFEDLVPALERSGAASPDESAGTEAGVAEEEREKTPETLETLPALQDGPQDETLADTPLEDAALAAPLEPIDSFDVRVPQEPSEAASEVPPPISYYMVVTGIEDLGLEPSFRDVSALDEGGREAANAAMLSARAEADAETLLRLLRSEGFYDAITEAEIVLPPEPDGRYRVEMFADPGQRYTLSGVDITGTEKIIPQRLLIDALELAPGDPIDAGLIQSAEASAALVLPRNGYPFAQLKERRILLDGEMHTGDYELPVDLGPRARFGGIQVEGDDPAFSAEHVAVLARFKRGDLYNVAMQDDLREAMVATGLFESVAAEPVLTRETTETGEAIADIRVFQDAGPARSLLAEAGFGTGQGFRLEGAWVHRNLFPPEGALEARAVAGTKEQLVSGTFRRSNAGLRDRTVQLGINVGRQDFEAFEAFSAGIIGRISRESTPIWQKRWTYAYGAELIASRETRFETPERPRDHDTFFIGALPVELGYDASNDLLDPSEGFRLRARLSPEASLQSGDFDPYLRTQLDGSIYQGLSDDFVLAARTRFSFITGIARDEIPPSRRLYAGGGGSVRGYGFQDIGPRDTENRPLGGRSANEFAIEGRYRFGNWGAVAFFDAGQVYEREYPDFSDLQYGAGLGVRYYTNFGPFRADIGIPLNRRAGQSDFAIYISIGQAF